MDLTLRHIAHRADTVKAPIVEFSGVLYDEAILWFEGHFFPSLDQLKRTMINDFLQLHLK